MTMDNTFAQQLATPGAMVYPGKGRNPAPSSIDFPDQPDDGFNPLGYGACDANANNYKQALENWRYSTGVIKLTRDVVTGDLSVAAGTTLTLFNGGAQDLASTQGFPGTVILSDVETDAFQTGAPTKQNAMFHLRAIGMAILKPFAMPDPFTTKRYDRWIENYEQPIIDAFHNNLSLSLQYAAEECNWKLGLLSMYPQHGNSTGAGSIVRNGAGIGIAQIMPLRVPADMGAQDRSNQADIQLSTSNYITTIGNDAVIPTEADLYLPIQLIAYGAQRCEPCDANGCLSQIMSVLASKPSSMQQQILTALAGK